MPTPRRLLPLLLLALAWPAAALAAGPPPPLPIPRFVSLRAGEVNLRTGPGTRYPVEWVYRKRDVPVEVIASFEEWRKVRDWQGTEGWVHETFLSSRRMMVVTGEKRRLRADPDEDASALAYVEPEVIGRLLACPKGREYCKVEVNGIAGWLLRSEFWGVIAGENFD